MNILLYYEYIKPRSYDKESKRHSLSWNELQTTTMDSKKENIQKLIREEFPKIQNQEDLLRLLNAIHEQMYATIFNRLNKPVPKIELKTLTYYKNIKLSGSKRYKQFTIKKKSGKDRTIHAPAKGLKLIQQCLNEIFKT